MEKLNLLPPMKKLILISALLLFASGCGQKPPTDEELLVASNDVFTLEDCPDDQSNSLAWDNCVGTYTSDMGFQYVGEFKDGMRYGQGTLTFGPNSALAGNQYVCEFKDGHWHGQ